MSRLLKCIFSNVGNGFFILDEIILHIHTYNIQFYMGKPSAIHFVDKERDSMSNFQGLNFQEYEYVAFLKRVSQYRVLHV